MRIARLNLFGVLDRYVGSLFIGAYVTSLLLVVGLLVIFDAASNLKFFEPWDNGDSASTAMIVRYYALQTPFLFLQVAPFVTVIAAMFTLIKLVRQNELVAALNAGVSAQRATMTVFLGALLAALAMFGVREVATEKLGPRRDALHDVLAEQRRERVLEDVWFRDIAGNIVHFASFWPQRNEGLELEVAIQSGATIRVVSATRATWDGATWQLEQGSLREETGTLREETGETSTAPTIESLAGLIAFTPRDVLLCNKGFQRPLELSFSEVGELLARDPDNREYQTLLQYHLTFPLANLVLLLVTLPFLVGRERGNRFEGLALACGMCVLYFAVDFVTRSLGMDGSLSPLMASWLPVLAFGSLGVVLYEGARS